MQAVNCYTARASNSTRLIKGGVNKRMCRRRSRCQSTLHSIGQQRSLCSLCGARKLEAITDLKP